MTDIRHRMTIEGDAARQLDSISKSAKTTDSQLSDISKTAPAMGKALKVGAGVGLAAVVALAAGVAKASKGAIKLAGDLNKLAKQGRRVGALASEIDTLNEAFGLLTEEGVDSARVLEDVNRNLGMAAAGSTDVKKAFDLLELPDDFTSLDAISRVQMLVERIGAIEDPARRAEVASKTLGRGWRELQTVFESGEGALEGAIEQVREAGVVSDDAAAQSEALIDAVDLAARSWETLKRDALEPLIPVLTDVVTSLGDVMRAAGDSENLREFIGLLGDITAGAIKAAAKVLGLANSYASLGEQSRISRQLRDVREELDKVREERQRLAEQGGALFAGGEEAFLQRSNTLRRRQVALVKQTRVLEEQLAAAIKKTVAASRAGGGGRAPAPRRGAAPSTAGAPAAGGAGVDVHGGLGAGLGVDISTEGVAAATEAIDDLGSALHETRSAFQTFRDTWESGIGSIVNSIGALAVSIVEDIAAAQRDSMTEAIAAAEATAREIRTIEQKLSDAISEEKKRELLEERARLEERVEAEREAALEAFRTQKALAIVAASINTALAIINAFATAPTIIVGAAMAVVAGAAGAVAIAKIASQKPPEFARGGVLREGDVPMVGGQVHARMEPGEGVATKQGLRNMGGPRALADFNSGRMGGGGAPVMVMKVGPRTTEAIAVEQLRPRSGHLATALRTSRPKHGRRVAGR